ncbi:MAG: TonB-dependent receptor [Acidobacteria bacterium]|nr:TonB-dependent receptor [Acidobacteriota bacterium]
MSLFLLCAAALSLTVTDPSGAPVRATGQLDQLSSGVTTRFTTDAQGQATLEGLAGRYRLSLAKPGFVTHSELLSLDAPVAKTIVLAVGAPTYAVSVVATTPLPGPHQSRAEIPAPIQTATAEDLTASGALDLSDFANRRLGGVFLNEIQGNPLQPDLNYRGYTASPLLGTPQGVSLYMDGVRLNQPFGDVVSWDLIPRLAVAEMALIPGSNPLFGLNTLGGALSLRTKDGRSHPGSALTLSGGSFGRKIGEFEHGGSLPRGFHWFTGGQLFFEDGWRESSPSSVRQLFTKAGYQREKTALSLTAAYANNGLIGNGLQDFRLLARDFRSVYTKPDLTAHRSPFLNLTLQHALSPRLALSSNAYFRYIRTFTLNGDSNEDSLDQSLYQPNAAERAALAAAGFSGFPLSGETAANTPFPQWRCIANVLRRDEPAEKCNGLLNRTGSHQRNYGLSAQLSFAAARHQFTAGAAYDGNSVGFSQSTELGYLNPDRSVTPLGAFADGVTGGDVDGEPFDTRASLRGRIHTGSLFLTDTLHLGRLHLTASGRFNQTVIDNLDLIRPTPGTGSLTGRHTFRRFNPAIGLTYRWLYASYTEGSRAPTSIELGCADPAAPCRLPNALAGDPPLKQVVTRTVEAGLRGGGESNFRWNAGWFRSDNRDDILFVASEQVSYGYFRNFGKTLRQGLEAGATARIRRATLSANYTLLDATFRSPEQVNGGSNRSNDAGFIAIEPGHRVPLIPRHMTKLSADLQLTAKLVLNAGLVATSRSFARGNENNRHQPDGRLFLGEGTSPGYAVVNLGARYQLNSRLELFGQANNLLDRRYYSGAQLGATAFTEQGTFIARPFPAVNGVFPVRHSTFFAPGAPRGLWGGLRFRF